MTLFTLENYRENFEKMSPQIKEVMFSENTANSIKNITNRYSVEENAFNISAVIGYILVGLIPVKKLIEALREDALLDSDTAKKVAHDIRAEILAPVAKELADIQNEAEKNYEEVKKETKKFEKESAQENVNSSKIAHTIPTGNVITPPDPKDESVIREIFPSPEDNSQNI